MPRESIDLHKADPVHGIAPSPATKSYLDNIEKKYGRAQSQAIYKGLSAALAVIATRLVLATQQRVSLQQKIFMSTTIGSLAAVRIPVPQVPSAANAQKQINQYLPPGTTPDGDKIHQAIGQAQKIRNPKALEDFEQRKAQQAAAKASKEISEYQQSLFNVNGLKADIDRRIS